MPKANQRARFRGRIRRVLNGVSGLSSDDRTWLTLWLSAHWASADGEEHAWVELAEIVAGAKESR